MEIFTKSFPINFIDSESSRPKTLFLNFCFDGVTDPNQPGSDVAIARIIDICINNIFNNRNRLDQEFLDKYFQNLSEEKLENFVLEYLHPILANKCQEKGIAGKATGAVYIYDPEEKKCYACCWGDTKIAHVYKEGGNVVADVLSHPIAELIDKITIESIFANRLSMDLPDIKDHPDIFIRNSYEEKFNGVNSHTIGVIGKEGFAKHHLAKTCFDLSQKPESYITSYTDGLTALGKTSDIDSTWIIPYLSYKYFNNYYKSFSEDVVNRTKLHYNSVMMEVVAGKENNLAFLASFNIILLLLFVQMIRRRVGLIPEDVEPRNKFDDVSFTFQQAGFNYSINPKPSQVSILQPEYNSIEEQYQRRVENLREWFKKQYLDVILIIPIPIVLSSE